MQLAIRRNIELAFVKKAKVEFKGDRSETRILVSNYPSIVICVFPQHSERVVAISTGEKITTQARHEFETCVLYCYVFVVDLFVLK